MQSWRAFLCLAWLLGVAAPLAEPPPPRLRANRLLAGLPLGFEANRGQADRAAQYLSRGPGYALLLTATEAVMTLRDGPVVRMRWAGGSARAKVEGLERLPGQTNYFLGSDPSRWQTGVPSFRKVRYAGLYPGIDLVLYGQQGRLEYDWVVSPGADLAAVRLDFPGAGTRVDERGDLVVKIAGAELRHQRPRIYQQVGGRRKELPGSYRLRGDGQVGFEAEGYDPALPLVVDPVLVYSTYLGGSANESAYDVTADAAGNVYVTGWTASASFPVAAPYQRTARGQDAFVTKINAAGNALVFSTYLGGSSAEVAHDIAVDGAGSVYVTGETWSTDFPMAQAYQTTLKGTRDAFVTKLNASGSALVYSTYLGGSNLDVAYGIAVDDAGSAYVAGYTYSQDFPTQNPIQTSLQGTQDAFVAKLAPAGSSLVYATYLGGTGGDAASDIAVDAARNAYLIGTTGSLAFPLVNPLQSRRGGTADNSAFVSKLNPAGTALVYSTYLGGADNDDGAAIAVNAAGEAYVVGRTRSTDFPTAKPIQARLAGDQDGFLAQLNAAGSALGLSTYLGGTAEDATIGVALDAGGNVYVAGSTESDDFPFVQALQPRRGRDALAIKISAAGTTVYATPVGGSGLDGANAMAVDGQGNAYVAGYTSSSDFPTAAPLQGTLGGGTGDTPTDAMVVKISESGTPAPGPLSMVSAASFAADALAPESIASAYGQNLAAGLAVAETPALPERLGDTTVKVTDSAGVERTALLFFVSSGQVNFLVPTGTAAGRALVKVLRDGQVVASGNMTVAAVAPGLFTANANGRGVAAALALRVAGDGTQSTQLIFECAAAGQCSAVPVDPGLESDQVFLLLFGTGIRWRSSDAAVTATIGGVAAEVTGAVPQGQYQGLDQVNVRLSRSLAGRGEVNIALTVDGKAANTVTVRVGGTPPPPPPTDKYLPLATGMSWEYRVQFPERVSVAYQPIFEEPQGVAGTSEFTGMCDWAAGSIDFKVTVGERLSTGRGDSYRVTLTDPGRKFFFCVTGEEYAMEMRAREVSGNPQLEMVANRSIFRVYRPLAQITAQDRAQTQTLTVPAGEFKDVIKTTVTLKGEGFRVGTGTYTTDVYLAPDVGIIKAVHKDSGGKVLYTQELTKASSVAPRITKVEPGSFKIGETVTLTITGENLSGVTGIEFGYPALRYTVTDLRVTATTATARLTATAPSGTVLNPIVFVTVWVVSPAGPSNSETPVLVKP